MASELEARGYGHVDVANGALGEISVYWRDHVLYRNRGLFHVPNSHRIVRRVTASIEWEPPRPT